MLGSLSVLTLAVAVWRPYIYHPESAPIVRTIELEKSEIRSLLPEASEPIDQAPQEEEAIPQDELDEKADSDAGGHEYVVSTGDTLSSILNQYGIDMGDIAQLSSADKELRNLKIGQQLSWTLTADGDLQSLTWEMSRRETRTYTRVDNGFKMSSELQKGDWVNSVLKGTVGASFVSSARDAGLTSTLYESLSYADQYEGQHFLSSLSDEEKQQTKELITRINYHDKVGDDDCSVECLSVNDVSGVDLLLWGHDTQLIKEGTINGLYAAWVENTTDPPAPDGNGRISVKQQYLFLYDPDKLCVVVLWGKWETCEALAAELTIVQTDIPTPERDRDFIWVGALG